MKFPLSTKSLRNPAAILFAVLALLMIVTRSSHFSSAIALPGASTAVFFLAGFYFRSIIPALGLLALAIGLDGIAVLWGGVSAECFGPAYPFLCLAYLVLWSGGRWVAIRDAQRDHLAISTLRTLIVSAVVTSFIAHLLSSGSFYLFSGSFSPVSFSEFGQRIALYYPHSLKAIAVYLSCAATVHVIWWQTSGHRRSRQPT